MDKFCTDGALSRDALTGPHVRLWPYVPGVYGRDALYRVWRVMEDDGGTRQAFWDETNPLTAADLASFIKAFDGVPTRLLLLVESRQTQDLAGCFWLSEIVAGHQAFASMWMRKAQRGRLTDEAARLALGYAFATYELHHLWSLTPWPVAGALCERMGFRAVGRLPEFCRRGPELLDVTLYRLTKEQYHGLNIS